jgi:hypothetical protein
VPGRVEAGPEVIAAREAEAGQEIEGLPAHGLNAVDDRGRIGLGVLERPVQVVHHRQPALGNVGLRSLARLAHLPGAPLAHVVQLGQRAQPLILQFGDAGRRLGGRAAVPETRRPGAGLSSTDALRVVDDLCLDRLGGDGLGALAALTHGW